MKKCVVPGCSGVSELIPFPDDIQLIETWISVIKTTNLTVNTIKNEKICVDHFEKKYFNDDSTILNKKLRPDAVPTLSLQGDSKINCILHQTTHKTSFIKTNNVITKEFSKRLKDAILNLSVIDRTCVLIFKTIELTPKLNYNQNYDMIFGFQNINSKQNFYTQNAIVFMIQGLYSNWKQIITFILTDKTEFSQSIYNIIDTCLNLRLKIIATICDKTDQNITTMNLLKISSHKQCLHDDDEFGYESFNFKNHEIIILYDIPNLMKNIRNDFLKTDFQFEMDNLEFVAKKNDVLKIKNNLKYNLKQFYLNYNNNKDEKYIGTWKLINFFNELFDSLQGNVFVTCDSMHWTFWTKSLSILNTIKYIDNERNTISKLISTLYGIMHLWRGVLQRSNFKSFSPKYLNSNELNKFLSKIRSTNKESIRYWDYDEKSYTKYLNKISRKIKSKRNNVLTCDQFIKSFTSEIQNFADNRMPLCDATRPLLYEMIQLFIDKDAKIYDDRNFDLGINKESKTLLTEAEFFEFDYEPIVYYENSEIADVFLNKNQILNIIPFKAVKKMFIQKLYMFLKRNNCEICNKNFFEDTENLTKLERNSELINIFAEISLIVFTELPKIYNKPNIISYLNEKCNENDKFICDKHNLTKLINEMCVKILINTWISEINYYLSGDGLLLKESNVFQKQAFILRNK